MSNLPDAFARSSLLIGHEAQATGNTDQISTKGERFKAQYPVSLVMATMTQWTLVFYKADFATTDSLHIDDIYKNIVCRLAWILTYNC